MGFTTGSNNVVEQTIVIQQGSTFNYSGSITDNSGVSVDLTGYNFQGYINRFTGDTPIPFVFTILNQTTNKGQFTVSMSAATTLALEVSNYQAPNRPYTSYIGQFEIIFPDGSVYRFFEFAVNVDPVVGV